MSDWQPIETAPRREKILMWRIRFGIDVGTYNGVRGYSFRNLVLFSNQAPTHWMPLPAPPTKERGAVLVTSRRSLTPTRLKRTVL